MFGNMYVCLHLKFTSSNFIWYVIQTSLVILRKYFRFDVALESRVVSMGVVVPIHLIHHRHYLSWWFSIINENDIDYIK